MIDGLCLSFFLSYLFFVYFTCSFVVRQINFITVLLLRIRIAGGKLLEEK